MKKLFFLAILPLMMAVVTFSSCSKNEDNGGVDNEILVDFDYPENQLFGTWNVIEMNGETPDNDKERTVVFSSDGTCVVDAYKQKYTATGSVIKITESDGYLDFQFDITSWAYPVVTGVFTAYDDYGPEVYNVVIEKVEK